MNHFWIMVLRKEANFLTPHYFICCKLLITLHPSAFAYSIQIIQITNARSSLCSNFVCTFKQMAPTPHVVMPKSQRMWLEANITNVSLGTLGVYCKSTRSLSHSKNACLLALVIAFCWLWWNQAKRLIKTCAFMAMWSWTFGPSSRVDGCSSLPNSTTTLWHVRKCCTKLYLVV
jgi:hypothetical protein